MQNSRTFITEDQHTIEIREGGSNVCPWGLDYAREIGVPIMATDDICVWALINDEAVYVINAKWEEHTRSDMYLDEWLEENADTYAGKLSDIKRTIYGTKKDEENVIKNSEKWECLIQYLENAINEDYESRIKAPASVAKLYKLALSAKKDAFEETLRFVKNLINKK